MISKTYPLGSFERYKYVVIMSRMDGGFLLSRHKQRTTWEFQGGHIEPGETPMCGKFSVIPRILVVIRVDIE